LQEVLEVVAGQYHTCARLSHGVVKCWGDNSYGMLGVGDTFTRGNDPWDMESQLPTLDLGTGIPARS
jgi:alpha-tubulin suppressor-like RCC1 family protein